MFLIKQSLCRPLRQQAVRMATRLGAMLVLGALSGWMSQSWAASPSPETPEQQLTQSVQRWVASQLGGAPEQVRVLPMDARVRVQACARPLVLDLPFAGKESVRVRCQEPVWQLYVRVESPVKLASLAAAAPTSANASGAAPVTETRRMVVLAAQNLLRGMTVAPSNVREQMQVLPPGGGAYLEQVAQALHSELVRDIPAGTPLRATDLRPLVLVKRGQWVQLNVGRSTGFMVTARVEAMQDGRMGEHIKLKNPESGRMLSGVVRGPGVVEAP
jgi:flagella basal body P-ring formation protein FlgA